MITLWVKSCAGRRVRRMHRWRVGADQTICGLPLLSMTPVSTKWRRQFGWHWNGLVPKMCHECFKYNYRYYSKRARVPSMVTLCKGEHPWDSDS